MEDVGLDGFESGLDIGLFGLGIGFQVLLEFLRLFELNDGVNLLEKEVAEFLVSSANCLLES